ncbi:MAG: Maf family nucleotide pyrophosphatase [Flavobacteriaceae bacterium]|nr:septum formation protein Maf [Mangrovimonas sp.]MCB0435294.1 septum formation protein Maf [Mangrovimonas sp.]MCB0439389.1 septum formation protein Maf [Mangrovimonas sp.]HPF97030.1 Maf family nucleotide pyrophosphatase [Mangrovimonas sp.]HRV55186.1 Maf family nucleotide pyrophosphatase [Mangrovimonas sp.]
MLPNKLNGYHVILASGSPRRQQLLKDLGIEFTIDIKPVDEIFPERLRHFEVSDYLAQLKALPFKETLREKEILITSDTVVWHQETVLGKPASFEEAFAMLKSMSNTTHEVITSVCFTTMDYEKTVNCVTKVTFKAFSDDEISYYINTCKPFDKAGAYGIQEWIGKIGVTKIEGSYFNVVGFPVHLVYSTLLEIVK